MTSLSIDAAIVENGFDLELAFDIEPAETVAIVGPNGAGKSTLVRAITGLTPISRGREVPLCRDGHV